MHLALASIPQPDFPGALITHLEGRQFGVRIKFANLNVNIAVYQSKKIKKIIALIINITIAMHEAIGEMNAKGARDL